MNARANVRFFCRRAPKAEAAPDAKQELAAAEVKPAAPVKAAMADESPNVEEAAKAASARTSASSAASKKPAAKGSKKTSKKSGKKMFMTGSNDSIYVKVEAGDKISQFDPSLEGNIVIASGILTVITIEEEHQEHAEGENCASEGKGKDYVLTCESIKTL